jgi:hypothetical protein
MSPAAPTPPEPPALARRLLASGLLTSASFEEALRRQQSEGGHLDTALLELDAVPEDRILESVAALAGFPAARAEDLRGIDDDVLALVPAKFAKRLHAIPFAATTTSVSVAMLEPRNLALHDELAFVTGRRVVAYVALELRLREALEKFYGEPMHQRLAQLVDRANRARYMWQDGNKPAGRVGPPLSTSAPARPATGPGSGPPTFVAAPNLDAPAPPADATTPTVVATAPPGISTVAPPANHGWTPPPLPLPQLGSPAGNTKAGPSTAPVVDMDAFEARLSVLGDREQIGHHLLGFLRRSYPRVVLFMVKRDEVHGWLGSGHGVDLAALDAFRLNLSEPSLFADIAREGNFFVGPMPPLPAHRRLASLWGGQLPRRCLLLPVRIKERLVSVVYCDIDAATPPIDVYALQRLAAATGQAFEFCIVRRKLDQANR